MGYKEDRLIEFLPWASRFARLCASNVPCHVGSEDLRSAGVVGYLRAASRYDETRGASFKGYCALRIRGAVLDELRRWNWVPRSIQKSQKHILSVTEGLTERLDRDPTNEEVADAMGIDVNALLIQQNESQPRQVVSFDEMSEHGNGEENLSLGERLPDPSVAGPDTEVISQEERRRMLRCLAGLSKSQLTVIVLHYLNDISFRDIARTLSVTPSRVSQIHQSGLGRLRVLWSRNPPGGRHG